MEQAFADYLGIEKVIWLGCGIKGDDTHGHVDDISRFVAADTVLTLLSRTVATPTANRCGKSSPAARCHRPSRTQASDHRTSAAPPCHLPGATAARQLCQLLYC